MAGRASRRFFDVFVVTIFLASMTSSAAAKDRMELHLVLAIDTSASVNDVEFDLQRTGTANALRSSVVSAAIEQTPGGVGIAIVQWSSVAQQVLALDWVELHTIEDVNAYADMVDDMPRILGGGGTMIHTGLDFSANVLERAPGQARRQVIDISGNGKTDDPKLLFEYRRKLLSQGIVVNGLAIEEDDKKLTNYFVLHVIGGANAFVVTADDFDEFAEAMEIKLLREIGDVVFSMQDSGKANQIVTRR
ncbi:von Willebrand factor type A domain protein [Roseovarius aestuarii]|uniref:von Willebrand factor type A domain protein n=1 Tax=Roseovarius aestuarii TaxID=475083 RepID=A0A1X7BT36_9RHOB|nr:von Willebrand factor type A domain protein [Roseovarius aestuarii]